MWARIVHNARPNKHVDKQLVSQDACLASSGASHVESSKSVTCIYPCTCRHWQTGCLNTMASMLKKVHMACNHYFNSMLGEWQGCALVVPQQLRAHVHALGLGHIHQALAVAPARSAPCA